MAVMGVTIGCAQPYAIYMSLLLCRFAGYYVLRQVRVIWYEDMRIARRPILLTYTPLTHIQ